MHIYQRTHFNKNVSINNIPVGGLNVEQAYKKVKRTRRQSKIYVNNQLVYRGPITSSGFTTQDKERITKALHRQYTLLPSHQRENLLVEPVSLDKSSIANIITAIDNHIHQLNAHRKASHDAYAVYQNGKVTIVPAVYGTKFSYQGINKTINEQFVNGTIRIKPVIAKPLDKNSKEVRNEKQQLDKLLNKTVTYRVQNTNYHFKTNDIITKAKYQKGHFVFNTTRVKPKIQIINSRQATLGKSFQFKTASGKTIRTARHGSYGWKISAKQAGQTLANAIVKKQKKVDAINDTYGKGYSHLGTGYNVTSNDGIGKSYVEVSLAKQHAWFYRHGKCVLSTNIVSGSNDSKNRTPKGVWYIMYQQSPSVLRGNNDDGSKYSSPVKYWSPFTLSGCGFHDASWRHDWSQKAYKETGGGSHGCINMKPSNAGAGYHALFKGEPVVIY